MKQFILKHKRSLTGLAACLLIGVVAMSFQDTPFVKAILDNQQIEQEPQDTIKKKKNSMTMKEFDRLSEELDKDIMEEISKIDMAKIEREVLASLKEIDIDKIMKEVELSLKDIDTDKILADVKKELSEINYDEISAETKEALSKANKEVEKAMEEVKKIDREKIKKELEEAKQEVEKSRHEFEKIDMEKIMKGAREGIDKAKTELKLIKQMFKEMEQDGLIDSKKGFKIEYKEKSLFINGTKQSEQVADKYKKYFKGEHFEITIDKE